MNRRNYLSILLLSGIICVTTSCIDEIKDPQKDPDCYTIPIVTKASEGYNKTDSLTIISRYQSDPDIIMLNNITYDSTGKPMLLISREEAEDLGISTEIYQKYYDYVYTENK